MDAALTHPNQRAGSGEAYDSRAWTGEIPDYRAMIRRALGLDCQLYRFHIALHVMSAVTPEMRAEIERLCSPTPDQPA